MKPEIHDAANIFPMDEATLGDLADDILAHGQMVPVEIYEGKILDGRRRWAACERAGVKPKAIDVTATVSDPIQHVLSLNLHRRHLDTSQRAMVGARAREVYDRQARERQKRRPPSSVPENLPEQARGDSRDFVGRTVKVSGKTIDNATKVIDQGTPELIKAVDEGHITVSKAATIAAESEEVQQEEVKKAKTPNKKPTGRPVGRPPKPREAPKDEQGAELPAELVRDFADPWRVVVVSELAMIGERIRKAKAVVERNGLKMAGLATVVRTLDSSRTDIEIAIGEINESKPYAVCPKCSGSKCDFCVHGWLTRSRLKEMKARGKA